MYLPKIVSTVKAKAETFILHYIMVAHSLILFLTCFFCCFTGANAFWLEFVELVYRHFVSLEKYESFRSPNGDGTTIFMWLILATRKSSRCFSVILSFGLAVENQPETIQNYAHLLDHALPTYKMTRAWAWHTTERSWCKDHASYLRNNADLQFSFHFFFF